MLKTELHVAWRKRAEVTRALSTAVAEGDHSENAEYTYQTKELILLDRHIHYLQQRITQLTVINKITHTEQIFFSA